MTETIAKDTPTFKAEETVRLQFTATDDNGVARAEIKFRNEGKRRLASVRREIELSGEPEVTAEFEFRVGEELIPGHYVCEYIVLTNKLGNRSIVATPGIEFYVAGDERDHEGPELQSLSFA